MNHRRTRRPLLVVAGLFLVLLLAGVPAQAAVNWHIETVDSTGDVGSHISLALDTSGQPHISYYDADNSALKYAAWNGGRWEVQTVDSVGDVGAYTSLALDSSGYPHISYFDSANGDLKYAVWTGSSWEIQTVDSAGDVGGYTSLALDRSDNPHISYAGTNFDLTYAAWTGSSWDIQTVDSAGLVGVYTSLALDSSDNPSISYYDTQNGDLKYAAWTGSSWDSQTVDSAGLVGGYTSLALDSSDNPRISYLDTSNSDLKYAAWTGSSWDIQTVDSAGGVGAYSSLALDSSGYPHISYRDDTNHQLKYAAWTGSSWDIQTVDSTANVGTYTSLALDGGDNPHISYYDFGNHDLKYAASLGDAIPPTTTASATTAAGSYTFGTWANQSVTVTLSASDGGGSGVDQTFSTVDTGTQQTYSNPFALSEEGSHTVSYWSTDNVGNTETPQTVTVKIDLTAPVISYTGNQSSYTVDQTVDISCAATDALSGIASSTCQDINAPAASFAPGVNTVSSTASDNAGNMQSGSVSFTVEVTPDSLDNLTKQYVNNPLTASLLSVPLQLVKVAESIHSELLKDTAVNSYVLLVNGQRGHALTNQQADTLIGLAQSL